MASVTITIQCGTEEQNRVLANAIAFAMEDSNIQEVLGKNVAYSEVAKELNIPEIWCEVYPDDNEDPEHELNIEFDE
jgi:hypothetical protein